MICKDGMREFSNAGEQISCTGRHATKYALHHLILLSLTASADVDECVQEEDICSSLNNSLCMNIPGNFTCMCRAGFDLKEGECKGQQLICYEPTSSLGWALGIKCQQQLNTRLMSPIMVMWLLRSACLQEGLW